MSQEVRVPVRALSSLSCVMVDKAFAFSGPQFPQPSNKDGNAYFWALL